MAAPHHKLKLIALTLTLGVAGLLSGPVLANHDGPSFGLWLANGSHDRYRSHRGKDDRHRSHRSHRGKSYRHRDDRRRNDRRRYDYRDGFYRSRANHEHRRQYRRGHRDRRPSWISNIRRPGIYFLDRGHWAHYFYIDARHYGYCDERGRHSHGSLNFSW